MRSKTVREYLRSHVLGLVAIFIALTGTAIAGGGGSGDSGGPEASASAVTLKKLNRKIAGALQRIAALEAKPAPAIPTTLPPSGPASGALAGTYPSPQIADDAVTLGKIANNAVTGTEISDGSITGREFFTQEDVSLNFPSIDAGTCSAMTLQRQGTSDAHLLVTPPEHFADTFTLTGKLDAVSLGIVQYRFVACNVFGGGGAADPDASGGGTYRALVITDGFLIRANRLASPPACRAPGTWCSRRGAPRLNVLALSAKPSPDRLAAPSMQSSTCCGANPRCCNRVEAITRWPTWSPVLAPAPGW